ncbi:MAG: hypothetical protein ABR571_08910, partial [Jatrophihabitans sp.]
TFKLYGPSDTADCTGTAIFTSTVPLGADGTATSGTFSPTTAGSYYWTASYSGDVNNLPDTEACGGTDETSTVGKTTTVVGTAASSATVGGPISDTATVTGGLNPTGMVTFKLYGPSDTADCTGTAIFTSTVPLGADGTATSGTFSPTTAGSYYWVAAYSGDDNNAGSTGACGAEGETSTVGKLTTVVGTSATSGNVGDAVSDTATLSGATATAGGTITFSVFGPSDSPDCTGDAVFTSTITVDGNGPYTSQPFTPTTAGSYYWVAAYSGDENNIASSGGCGDDGETSTLNALGTGPETPSPQHSPEVAAQQQLAATGAGPVHDQIGWALALLVLGAGILLVGKRRGYRRTH